MEIGTVSDTPTAHRTPLFSSMDLSVEVIDRSKVVNQ